MRESSGHTYPLVGPSEYTLRELLELVMRVTGHRRPILGLGSGLSTLQAAVFERLPGKMITRDNMRSMSIPNTSSKPFPAIFGEAHSMESVVPGYLQNNADNLTGRARYNGLRYRAGRNL
jgi:NADH dehydrogenase